MKQQNNKLLSMLGIARRAGRLSMGHDMAAKSIASGKARLLLFANDISERAKKDMLFLIEKQRSEIPVIYLSQNIDEIHFALGYKAGIITVDDDNFAQKIKSLASDLS